MHPVVREFVGGTRDGLEILQKMPEPLDVLSGGLLKLYQARAGRRPFAEAFEAAESVPEEGNDANLYFLFLAIWSLVSLLGGRLPQAEALARRAESLLSKEILPDIHSTLMMVKAALAANRGDHAANEQHMDAAIEIRPSESPRYDLSLLQRAVWRARRGRGVETTADLEYLTEAQRPGRRPNPSELALVHFIDCVATGRAGEAAELLEKIDLNAPGPVSKFVAESRPVLDLMLRKWDPETSRAPAPAEAGSSEPTAPWIMSTYSLLKRQQKEGLDWARRMAGQELTWAGFPSFTLIRAELACGNGEAARRLLRIKQSRGGKHYFDDLFLARIELLAGRRQGAARHFAAVLQSVERYRARGMLDFELSLAGELSPGNLIELGRLAAGVEAAPPTRPDQEAAGSPTARGAGSLVGQSSEIAEVRELIGRFAPLDVPVLLTGETGTGKELAARALHEDSPRSGAPFVAVNCGAISENLLESELFGHERGAFTGAARSRKGIFEEAGEGTVFLDEIGDIVPRLQVALLRVLESRDIRPVGASRTRKISCRIVAATNADLEKRAEEGSFRKDLLYRLRRLEIDIPPLRERHGDILSLADHFLSEGRHDGQRPVMSGSLKARMLDHDWPGNVRELRNVIERMRLLNSDKLSYDAADLSLGPATAAKQARARVPEREPAPPPSGVAPDRVKEILRGGKSSLRRRERLRELFREHRQLTRKEVVEITEVAPATATKDLKVLCAEGFIEKVMPSASPRSHYFSLSAQ